MLRRHAESTLSTIPRSSSSAKGGSERVGQPVPLRCDNVRGEIDAGLSSPLQIDDSDVEHVVVRQRGAPRTAHVADAREAAFDDRSKAPIERSVTV